MLQKPGSKQLAGAYRDFFSGGQEPRSLPVLRTSSEPALPVVNGRIDLPNSPGAPLPCSKRTPHVQIRHDAKRE